MVNHAYEIGFLNEIFQMVEVDIICWIMRYENEIETGRETCIGKGVSM
jgi:hypothetical protein